MRPRDEAWLAEVRHAGPRSQRFDHPAVYAAMLYHATSTGSSIMEDDVTTELFTPGCAAYAGYWNGSFANMTAVRSYAASQGARSFSYTPNGDPGADAIDIEPGDATPGDAPGFYSAKGGKGVYLYGGASWTNAIISTMVRAGVSRNSYKLVSAHYTGPHICGPSTCGYPQADATQFTDTYNGRSLDATLFTSSFFDTPTPTENGDDMTPGIAYWNNAIYYAVRGSDGVIYFKEPGGSWEGIAGSHCQSGVALTIDPSGKVVIAYVNTSGVPCVYVRASGGGSWSWGSLGGNVG